MAFFSSIPRRLAGFFGGARPQPEPAPQDYFDQDGMLIGNGGDASRPASAVAASAPARQPAPQAERKGPGFWRTVDEVLGGKTISEVRDEHERKRLAQQSLAEMLDYAREAHLSPLEMIALRANPSEFAKSYGDALSSRHKTMDVAGGHSVGSAADGISFVAPELRDREGVYGTQGVDGYQPTGRAPASYPDIDRSRGLDLQQGRDKVDEVIKRGDLLLKGRSVDETGRHNRADEGLRSAELPTKIGVSQIAAGIAAKIAAGQPLSPGEQKIYDDYNASRQAGGMFGIPGMANYGDENPAAAPGQAQPAAPAKPAQPAPSTPPIDRLSEGVNTRFANGQVWTLRGGKAQRVK